MSAQVKVTVNEIIPLINLVRHNRNELTSLMSPLFVEVDMLRNRVISDIEQCSLIDKLFGKKYKLEEIKDDLDLMNQHMVTSDHNDVISDLNRLLDLKMQNQVFYMDTEVGSLLSEAKRLSRMDINDVFDDYNEWFADVKNSYRAK